MQNIMKKTFRSVLSMFLTFLAGVGLSSALQNNKPVVQMKMRPQLENKDEKPAPLPNIQPKQETTPRPRLGRDCTTCGMG